MFSARNASLEITLNSVKGKGGVLEEKLTGCWVGRRRCVVGEGNIHKAQGKHLRGRAILNRKGLRNEWEFR